MIHHQAPPAYTAPYIATAYCLKGRMANGQYTKDGSLAVDPRMVRLGTPIRLAAISSTPIAIDGAGYTASDTGGDIRGRRIDVWMQSCSRAIRFGRRLVRVII